MYLNHAISRDTVIAKTYEYDVVIVGAGLAGLYAALNIDENLRCVILAKENMDCSSSWLAQGGIAAAINRDDTPELHFDDTIIAGAGECNTDAVTVLVNEGPSDIETLVELNVPFDLDEYGEFHFTREGGHKKRRVVHAGGDATGRETIRALSYIVSERKNIDFCGYTCLFDVLTDNNDVLGVVVRHKDSEFHLISAANVIIATGGIGQLYTSSTNPPVATGDGIAAAIRAGVSVSNLEFIQFHPTGLWDADSNGSEFLISEAIRGEGGLLFNHDGVRFMTDIHKLAELAPRDIVARGIVGELKRSGQNHVFLDITSKSEDFLKTRFPTIYNECLSHGINIAFDKIPVSPIQHYLMGGIVTDLDGCTVINGFYVCGEAANTGVHGANRLASNSMLECLVFGRRAASHINNRSDYGFSSTHTKKFRFDTLPSRPRKTLDYPKLRTTIQQLMTAHCHVIRNKSGLQLALERVSDILSQLKSIYDESNEYLEALNIATVAKAIVEAALSRPESIGSHYMEI
ncbi:MAG: L-aspartate oxidase [Oscillospiraceae bacterium]|jgi:L-aspartate oxidase|nr:L-aspartate oxidase [Oscillospiraceae bacterium]